jgi:O-antigen/teichoic acid export membrane protein
MKNPFEELPDLPSQRRYHRLHLFPWEEATQKVSQFNGVKRPGSNQIAAEPTQQLPRFNGGKPSEGRQAPAGPTQRVSQFNSVRRPQGRQTTAEPTPTLPEFNSVRRPQGRQTTAGSPHKMPLPSRARSPEGRRPVSASPLRLPARMQPIPYKLEPQNAPLRTEDDSELDKLATIPVMVLRDISKQQGSPEPVMKSEISNAAGSAAFVSIGNIGGSILKYGSNLVIQRGFGPAGFGLYSLSLSLVTLVVAIFNLGLDDAMVRYVSIYRAKWRSGSLRGLAIFCSALVGVSGLIGAFCVLFLAPWLAAIKHSPDIIPLLQEMSPMVPLMTLQTIWISGLQGFKEFRWRVLLQRILLPVILILLLLGALILFHDLQALVLATIIYSVIGAILSLSFFLRKVSNVVGSETEEYQLREWFGFATPNFLTSVIDTVLESADTLLLAYFAISNTGLGQYAAAIKISGFILMPQASFNAMFAPTIAELYSKGERQKLEAMFKVVTKWAITFSLPIFGIATLFSASLLAISGDKFVEAWPLVIAFCIGTMINVSTGSVGYMLLMTGHQKTSFLNSLTAVIVNVGIGFILAPRYGPMGVAIATGMAVSIVNLMRLLQVRLLVKMQPYRWDVLKPVAAWLVSSLFTGSLLYLLSLAHISVRIYNVRLPFELSLVPVFLVTYIGLLARFKVSPEDQIVLDMLRRKFKRGKKNKKK